MSGFKFHGRRVAEPKPRVRTSGLDPPDELRSAWQDMEKAKSALRRAEFRVAEHDLPGAESSDLSMPAVAVDRVPLAYSMTTTALLDDLRAGEFSESMKPVKKSRKVSRLEEKSRDINAPPPAEAAHNRSPLREPNTQDPLKLTLKPFVDDTIDSLQWRADSAESFDCDTTRSTAIRDTRVNFLNERPLPEQRHGGARGAKSGESHKPKLVSVDVHVPGQKSRKDSKKKLKKTFKDIEDKEGGLLKVKELIMKQRRQISDKGSTESLAKPPPISDPLPQKPVHREDDPVLMNVERPKLNQAVRKVASGPALPTYRGFSTTENRLENDHMLRHTDAMLQQQYAPVKDKKRRVVSMQQKVAKIEHQKPARIIAPMKKPSKYDQKEIITTSSWRAGQKLVQDKFGPLTKPALDSPPTKDVGPDLGHNGSYLEDKPPARNVDRHANLPVSAKTILADMKSDDEEHEMKPHDVTRTITGVKRSAKSAADVESAHDKKLMKVRHYVSSDVRRYMNSKRAERKKQIQEAELARRKAEDIRRQQLDELQRKQKLRAKSHSRERKSREHSERGESDKENRLGRDDASTDSGTLTDHSSRKSIDLHEGDDIFAAAPAAQPGIAEKSQRTEPKVPERVAPNASGVNTQALPGEGLTVESIINKYRCETGMTVDDVVAKYAKQAASIKASYSKKHRGVKNFGSFLPAARPCTAPSEMALAQSRAERIAAIKSTATSLSSRLAAETLRITRDSGVPTDAWEESSEPLGRYQRLNALHNEPGVFSSGLPGDVHREFHQQTERHYRNVAATKIQAVYRGHSVRQGLTWQLPGHDVVLPERTSNITEKYGFAEDLGEDLLSNSFVSDDPSVAPVQIALKGSSTEPNISSFGMAPKQPARSYSTWSDDARGDRYSVLNVFARKHGRLDLPASNVRSAADSLRCASPVSTASGDTLSSKHSDAQGYSYEEDFTAASHPSAVTKTHSSLRFSTQQKLSADEVSEEDISRKDDDTLESLSPSITSRDDDNDSIDARQLSVADEDLSRSLVLSSKKQLSDDLSEVSSLADEASESSRQDDIYAQIPKKHTVASRLAPSALEGRMTMELNLLESMEESMRQITEMERTRAIALAQQETVSLAQILKARQQTHSRELTELQLKTQQENQEASRQLEEARYRAAESAQNAAATIAQVRQENNSSLHESSKKLIASQAEAAKATANAAKQLAEAQLAIMNPPPVVVQIPETQLRESVASALKDELSRHVGIPVKEDRAAQYSHHSIAHLSRSHRDSSSRMTDISYASDTFDAETSLGKSGRRSELRDTRESSVRSVVTASDSSIRRDHTSSVQTESGVPTGTAKTDSITEDIPSERDYDLDTSATEDELEKSLRSVLPSEMQRKRLKSESLIEDSMAASFSSDDFNNMLVAADSGSASPNRRLSFEGDSFSRFTVEMVRQYMQEEEIRAQHQSTLLKLRELALREKTKAELAWLEQQKRQMRSKGADDKYPAYKKRQKMIIRRLQHQQEEIKRLREVQKAASKERQLLLLQFQEISKMRQSTKQIARHLVKSDYERAKRWLQKSQTDCSVFSDSASVSSSEVRNRLKLRPSLDITTDDESTLLHLDDSIASPTHASPAKGGRTLDLFNTFMHVELTADRSDLEALRPQSPDANIELKLKKLDEKFLTIREQELQKRKQRLSKEKHEPVKDDEKDNRPLKQLGKRERERRKEEARTPRTADSSISTDLASDAMDRVDTARTAKSISTISEEIATELSSKPSEDSIQEDIKSRLEVLCY
ncbi:hypothetical protein CAPTEDRAFT_209677 [Capitella teleta]|uniref:Centrosome-associated protein 350 n=1 Tax=Capitella teleta TaxID=283909 RepID=R7UUX0_CAPTE|nr:hypothetical protein CAPTEDRAFT_209677 [Capitella teleta]|eukprot:ELU10433.1 hypothetical protein CAPTEDRAFT_209677 [Capitella teleta]